MKERKRLTSNCCAHTSRDDLNRTQMYKCHKRERWRVAKAKKERARPRITLVCTIYRPGSAKEKVRITS